MAKKRILIVEDDASVLKMIRARLEHEGYEVLVAMDGAAALRTAAERLPIHVVLLDIRLPRLNGYEVCRALKRTPATSRIPVIVVTASESQIEQLADRCIEVGATDWIKKPFQSKVLLEKIHRALEKKRGEGNG
ncbi:MAG: response regulator [Candidatus Omnitrophica bacterium]|nr:response regulator [Candidatus Omnitrophota bacterium]